MEIILASKSPRRKELLQKLNLKFKIITSNIIESDINIQTNRPSKYCMYLANAKCRDIATKYKKSLVIGADTIVYYNQKIIEKPINREDAINQLYSLSDKTHLVYTGVSIIINEMNYSYTFFDKTYVTFYKLKKNDIIYYVSNFFPYDKAGSYGIQDWSFTFVKKINGCFNNVVGFPLSKFYKLACENYTLNNVLKENGMKWKKK